MKKRNITETTAAMKKTYSLFSLLLLSNISAQAADWPHWRGPDFNGHSKETEWSTDWPGGEPKLAWKANVHTGFSSVAIADGSVYTLGNRDNLETIWCFDATTGQEKWKHEYECPLDPKFFEGGPTSTPTVDGGNVYTLSRSGHAFCLDATNGKLVWSRNVSKEDGMAAPTWGFSGSPLVLGNAVVLNVGAGGMALDKASGEILWKSDPSESGYSTPLPVERDGKSLVLMASAKGWIAVDPTDGKQLWNQRWITKYDVNAADPIVVGNSVFISSGYGKGSALLEWAGKEAPKIVWENKNLRSQMNPAVLVDGYLYGIDDNAGDKNELRCLELTTGKIMWSQKGIGTGGIIVANGKLIVLSARGELIVAPVSPKGFEPVARAQVLGGKCWTVPVLANGRVYCRNAKGDLVCVDLRK
jgi:outer membrane protein assembly factor BamB